MQIPIGWALDKFGPRLTAGLLFILGGGGGAVIFCSGSGRLACTFGDGAAWGWVRAGSYGGVFHFCLALSGKSF